MEECDGEVLKLKWVDINKGDSNKPKVRSRLVAKEVKRAKRIEDQLGGAEVFSATPPIESVYALMSMFMTNVEGKDNNKMTASWDISRAHFMGKAERNLFVELPPEDQHRPDDPGAMVGKLLKRSQEHVRNAGCFKDLPEGLHFVDGFAGRYIQQIVPGNFPISGEKLGGIGSW